MSGSCAVEPRKVDVIPGDTVNANAGDREAPNAISPETQPEDAVVK